VAQVAQQPNRPITEMQPVALVEAEAMVAAPVQVAMVVLVELH
jgi:hypothetical protein